MKLVSRLQTLTLDTNIFIYHLDSKSPFHLQASRLFETVGKKNIKIFTSNITLSEALSYTAPKKQIKALEEELLHIPNLQIIEVTNNVALEAARIRREYKFRLPDAIQLATAKLNKAQAFVSNDQRLTKFKELKVVQLKQLTQ